MAVSSKKTSPKPRQISQSSNLDDNFLSTANIKNLEDELNYIKSIIKHLKGTANYDTLSINNIENIAASSVNVFTFEQLTPSNEWKITHTLGRKNCNIIIFDLSYNQIFADVQVVNQSYLIIRFSEPVAGRAFLN